MPSRRGVRWGIGAAQCVLALTFHVDYWDDLGWRDRFALPSAAQRQRAYAKNLGLASVYTPQVIIDGHQNFVGSDRSSIGKALAHPRNGAAIDLSLQEGELRVALAAQQGVVESEVLLVAYQRTAVSPIARGENAGRTLREFNVVRDFRTLGRWQGLKQEYHWRLKLAARGSDRCGRRRPGFGTGAHHRCCEHCRALMALH